MRQLASRWPSPTVLPSVPEGGARSACGRHRHGSAGPGAGPCCVNVRSRTYPDLRALVLLIPAMQACDGKGGGSDLTVDHSSVGTA